MPPSQSKLTIRGLDTRRVHATRLEMSFTWRARRLFRKIMGTCHLAGLNLWREGLDACKVYDTKVGYEYHL